MADHAKFQIKNVELRFKITSNTDILGLKSQKLVKFEKEEAFFARYQPE